MKTILGLDISSVNVGWAVVRGSKMLDNGCYRRKKDEAPGRFAQRVSDALVWSQDGAGAYVAGFQFIAYEVNMSPVDRKRQIPMMRCYMMIGRVMALMGCPDIEVEVRADNRRKKQRRAELEMIYGKCANEHSADALAVAHQAMARTVGR